MRISGVLGLVAGRLLVGLAMAAIAAAPIAEARAQRLPGMGGFTESGKKGRFLATRIEPAALTKAHAAIADGSSGEGLLAAQSVNRGQLYGTGLRMQQTEQKLTELVAELAQHWKFRPVGNVRVRVVGTNSFVPQSFADNVIVVPFGVLWRAKTDEQVAWLIGHEFAHLALGHFAREARAKKRSRSIGQIVGAIDTMTLLAQHRVDSSGGKIRLYEVTDKETMALGDSIWARSRQLEGALSLFGAFFTRADEDKADVAGLDLAMAAGYADGGAIGALDIIANDQKDQESLFDQIGGAMGRYGEKTGVAALKSVGQSNDVTGLAVNWIKDFASNALVIAFSRTKKAYMAAHRPPEKRIEGIRRYYDRVYKDEAPRRPSLTWLKAVRATGEYQEAATAVNAHTKALASVAGNNPAQAKVDLQPALTTRYASTPMILNLAAKIAEMQGDLRGADRAYSNAERLAPEVMAPVRRAPARGKGKRRAAIRAPSPPPPPVVSRDPYLEQSLEGFVDHVTLLVRMRNFAKALAVIGEAKRRFNDDQAFLPQYIAIYFATKQTDMLVLMLNRCAEVADPAIEQGCRGAMLTDTQQKKLEEMSPVEQAKVRTALARTSSKARSRGVIAQLNEALSDKNEKDEEEE